jgi:hypothetical protein
MKHYQGKVDIKDENGAVTGTDIYYSLLPQKVRENPTTWDLHSSYNKGMWGQKKEKKPLYIKGFPCNADAPNKNNQNTFKFFE